MKQVATPTSTDQHQAYIGGKWVGAAKTFPVYDPSTEEVIAEVADCGPAEVDRAVSAARAAFDTDGWPQTTAQERGRVLFRLAEKVRQNATELA